MAGAFLVRFEDHDTSIEIVEQDGRAQETGVVFTHNRLLLVLGGRGVRLTFGSSRDAGALALALLSMSSLMAEAEQRASQAVGAVFASSEPAGHA